MVIRNAQLLHGCFSKHSRMGAARMKQDKEIEEGEYGGSEYRKK